MADLKPPVIGDLNTEGKQLFTWAESGRISAGPGMSADHAMQRLKWLNQKNIVWTSGTKPFGNKKQYLFGAHDLCTYATVQLAMSAGFESPALLSAVSLACYSRANEAQQYPFIAAAMVGAMQGKPSWLTIDTLQSPSGDVQHIAEIRFSSDAAKKLPQRAEALHSRGWRIRSSTMIELTADIAQVLLNIEDMKALH